MSGYGGGVYIISGVFIEKGPFFTVKGPRAPQAPRRRPPGPSPPPSPEGPPLFCSHQNRTIAIASDFRDTLNRGVPQRPLTLILLQKYRDTNGRRIVIQIGGVYTTFCQEEGILLQKYRDRNGRCIVILFKNIGVRGRFDSPDLNRSAALLSLVSEIASDFWGPRWASQSKNRKSRCDFGALRFGLFR